MPPSTETLSFQCPACRHEFHLEVADAVETAICPDCGASVLVPRFETLRLSPERQASRESDSQSSSPAAGGSAAVKDASSLENPESVVGHETSRRNPLGGSRPAPIYEPEGLADSQIGAPTEASYELVRRLAREEGLLVGISSGAAVWAALEIGRQLEHGLVVAILADGGSRYLSEAHLWEER